MPMIEPTILRIQELWQSLTMDSILNMQAQLAALAANSGVHEYFQAGLPGLVDGLELHRDPKAGFIVLAYAEGKGTYRTPHDHGQAWVIYAILSGQIEMGNYFKAHQPRGGFQLVLKSREVLKAGDSRVYYPGEIHDTRCVSEAAIILRLTSSDLREEERLGRMSRY